MVKPSIALLLAVAAVLAPSAAAGGIVIPPPKNGPSQEPADRDTAVTREIFVPFEGLEALLRNQPRRVLLSREQFEELIEKAEKSPDVDAPHAAVLAAADYTATIRRQRAHFQGTLTLEVLNDGLQVIELDLAHLGLFDAKLDGRDAAIYRRSDGRLLLLAEGAGRHSLTLEMIAPVETTAARQLLRYRLPHAPATRLRLTVPGDVEVKDGADVIRREVDPEAAETRFELLARRGDTTLQMTLNSRLRRNRQAVVASSVLIDEVTEGYERLHARLSMDVLHQAVEQFRFAVPEGFEVDKVDSPQLSRWEVTDGADGRVLDVRLRSPATETVVLDVSAVSVDARLDAWTFPQLRPIGDEIVGEASVLGLLLDNRLQAESVVAEGRLIRLDTPKLRSALPPSLLSPERGVAAVRSIVAYYAPQGDFAVKARFVRPPAEMAVRGNVLLIVSQKGHEALGGLALVPTVEKLFGFDLAIPSEWHVRAITGNDEQPLQFERDDPADGPAIVHVRVPEGMPPGKEYQVNFEATYTPEGWFSGWEGDDAGRQIEFPVFDVVGATSHEGAIAVQVRDDMRVTPEDLQGQLTPLGEPQKADYGLGEIAASLAYHYGQPGYAAKLLVERIRPRLTARSFSLLRVEPDSLSVRYEVIYSVERARVGRVALLMPKDATPESLAVRGLGGTRVKHQQSRIEGDMRRWTVQLERPRLGKIHLAVAFSRPAAVRTLTEMPLPLVTAAADGLDYQSGVVAVEGNADLEITPNPETGVRLLDVGELADASFQPGKRLLGVWGYVGEPTDATLPIGIAPRDTRAVPTAVVQRAALSTRLSVDGNAQTQASFLLRTKASYLTVQLPDESQLWSAHVGQTAIKPQRQESNLLIGLPGASGDVRLLRIVYTTPVEGLGLSGNVRLPAPKLFLRGPSGAEPIEVPLNDLVWRVYPPAGYQITRSDGTVVPDGLRPPELAAVSVAKGLIACPAWLSADLDSLMPHAPPYGLTSKATATKTAATATAAVTMVDTSRSMERHYSEDLDISAPDSFTLEDRQLGGFDAEPIPPAPDPVAAVDMTGGTLTVQPPMDPPMDPFDTPPPVDPPALPPMIELPDIPGLPPVPGRDEYETYRDTQPGIVTDPLTLRHSLDVDHDRSASVGMGRRGVFADEAGEVQATAKQPRRRELAGVRSLDIRWTDTGDAITFRSLGVAPALDVRLANRQRVDALAWGLALIVLLWGLAITGRSAASKVRLIGVVAVLATVAPLLYASDNAVYVCNPSFFVAMALVPYYLAAVVLRQFARLICRGCCHARTKKAAAAAGLLIAALIPTADVLAVDPPNPKSAAALNLNPSSPTAAGAFQYVLQLADPPKPIDVPKDAVILPYDPKSATGVADADKLLVPYDKYVELYNRAYPNAKLEEPKPPVDYALAGAAYEVLLTGEDYLLLTGRLQIDVFADGYVTIPLGLAGGALARAELDGKPARLKVAQVAPNTKQSKPQAAGPSPVVLYVSGKGRHSLDVDVRLALRREGGWRAAEGVLPSAPAAALSITVPQPQTELQLGPVDARRTFQSETADEEIDTALANGGAVQLRWRPKVAAGQIDRSLTAQSFGVLDVQEDGLRLVWQVELKFPGAQRGEFRLGVPAGYLVEKVEGPNVRGWQDPDPATGDTLNVTLLKAAEEQETLVVHLWRRGKVGQDDEVGQDALAQFDVPAVTVPEAAMHGGQLTVRRSPLLDVRVLEPGKTSRIDLTGKAAELAGGEDSATSGLGIRAYQAYRFGSLPMAMRLAATPSQARVSADVQTIVRIRPHLQSIETAVVLDVQGPPIHRSEIFLPDGLDDLRVLCARPLQWAVTDVDGRQLLTVDLATGRPEGDDTPLVIHGTLGRAATPGDLPLPVFEARNVTQQTGQFAVQADEAYDVTAAELRNCRIGPQRELYGWLQTAQRQATRLALKTDGPDYAGTVRLTRRQPTVSCFTISNVKVTDRTVEQTIVLNYNIEHAGTDRFSLLLPADLADAQITAPMLRRKTVQPVAGDQTKVRVVLEFQDALRNEVAVLIQRDRLLLPDTSYAVPLPVVEDARTTQRFATLESAGLGEIVIETQEGLKTLRRQQAEWQTLQRVLGTGLSEAFLADANAADPRLTFTTKRRQTVETTGARIGLAETNLVLDANGAYRAEVTYHVDNRTQQYLKVQLPADAELWAVRVADVPVKPVKPEKKDAAEVVRIPLIKTAPGELDYAVVLFYGGKLSTPRWLGTVDFPLARTVDVSVARSNVRLYVPRSHGWFDFGGTMRHVAEEADLAAETLAYRTKRTERLMETVRHGNEFDKVRAMGNLKKQMAETERFRAASREFGPNEKWKAEAITNYKAMSDAQIELLEAENAPLVADALDNRGSIKGYVQGQDIGVTNYKAAAGSNWVGEDFWTEERGPSNDDFPLNDRWLQRNKLYNPQVVQLPEGNEQEWSVGLDMQLPSQPAGQGQPANPSIARGETKARLDQSPDRPFQVFGRDVPGSNDKAVRLWQYQEKLKQQDRAQGIAGQRFGVPSEQPNVGNVFIPDANGDGRIDRQDIVDLYEAVNPELYVARGGDSNADGAVDGQDIQRLVEGVNVSPDGSVAGKDLSKLVANLYIAPGGDSNADGSIDGQDIADLIVNFNLQGDSPDRDWADGQDITDLITNFTGDPGPADSGSMSVEYDYQTGEFRVMADDVTSWSLTSPGSFSAQRGAGRPASGLRSLRLQLPNRDLGFYDEYLFTTPRGQIEITARAVSRSSLLRLSHLGGLVAVLIAAGGLRRMIRRGRFAWVARRDVAWLMIVAGLLSLLTGVFPVLGGILLLAAVGSLLRIALQTPAETTEPAAA